MGQTEPDLVAFYDIQSGSILTTTTEPAMGPSLYKSNNYVAATN